MALDAVAVVFVPILYLLAQLIDILRYSCLLRRNPFGHTRNEIWCDYMVSLSLDKRWFLYRMVCIVVLKEVNVRSFFSSLRSKGIVFLLFLFHIRVSMF